VPTAFNDVMVAVVIGTVGALDPRHKQRLWARGAAGTFQQSPLKTVRV
jgi:hypothetical protein